MNTNYIYNDLLPSHLNHLSHKLQKRVADDVAMYDILGLARETCLIYFLEKDEVSGGVGLFTESNLPDGIFSSGTLIGVATVEHDNHKSMLFEKVFVTLPFAEKSREMGHQDAPRITKYPAVSKAVLKRGIQDLNKLGVGKFIDVSKVGNDLFDKYNNLSLLDDVIAVDEKRQKRIDVNIAKRIQEHQHTQLFYNKIDLKPKHMVSPKSNNALFALHWLDHGGAEKFALASMRKARDMGYKVFCIVDKRGNKHYESQAREVCENIFNIADSLPREYWHRFYLNACNKLDINLFHIHHAISAYQALPKIRSMTNLKVITDTTHIIEHTDGGYVRISGVFSQYLDYHHIISRELNDYLTNELLVPYNKIKLGYLFNKNTALELNADKFQTMAERCNITFVGRFVNQKRPYLFIELVNSIVNNSKLKSKNLCFNMVGEGPLLPVCKQLIEKLGLSGKINLLPADHDVKKLLAESHFLIIPSENEGLTLVAYEAIENNCIIISSNVGSQKEIVASEALLSRYPREFINECLKLLIDSTEDTDFIEKLLNDQYELLQEILNNVTWEKALKDIYEEARYE